MLEREGEITLGQLSREIGCDSNIYSFVDRIINQFGGEIVVPDPVVEMVKGGGNLTRDQKAELFRVLTAGNGCPSTHLSKYLRRKEGQRRDNAIPIGRFGRRHW